MAVIPIRVIGHSAPATPGRASTWASVPRPISAGNNEPGPVDRPSDPNLDEGHARTQSDDVPQESLDSVESSVPEGPSTGPEAARDPVAELSKAYERLAADFSNYKRNAEMDMAESAAKGRDELLRALIPVLSELDSAAQTNTTDGAVVRRGVELIRTKLDDILAHLGYTRVATVGKRMDPTVHEAVATTPRPAVSDGQIVEEMAPGYTRDGKLVQPARVVVARKE